MSKKRTLLITGGAGYIGSYVNKLLAKQGHRTVVVDNLSRGSRKAVLYGDFVLGDIGNPEILDQIFTEYPIDAVIHFAAFINVGESIQFPAKYYHNNVTNTLQLLEKMIDHKVKNFLFSSTAAIYGIPQTSKVTEEHPKCPINPYGSSKLAVEKMLPDLAHAYGLNYISLRYFNVAGGDPDGELKNYKEEESNLIPVVLRSLLQSKGFMEIFGTDYPTRDGTCIRDYIHLHDLAEAHIQALEKLFNGTCSTAYNLGNGEGFSVKEVVEAANRITGQTINATDGKRRAGDPPILMADGSKAQRELNWSPQYKTIDQMVADAWKALKG